MSERDISGIKSAARFALQPNMLGYCGEDESQEILRAFVSEQNDNENLVHETLTNHGFPHLNAFLETIAEVTKRDTFEDDLVLSYWVGNDLTEKAGVDNKRTLIEKYQKQLPQEMVARYEAILPEKFYLTHLSQVVLIAAGENEGPEKIGLINHCMLAYGNVISIDWENKKVTVERDLLRKANNKYRVVSGKQTIKIDSDLTPVLEAGNEVIIHLGYSAAILTPELANNLKIWTRKVAEGL
jgi:hypothetical protein